MSKAITVSSANDFLKLVLQHVLPKGFRRVRDYGFLHGNANDQAGIANIVVAKCTSSAPTDDVLIVADHEHYLNT